MDWLFGILYVFLSILFMVVESFLYEPQVRYGRNNYVEYYPGNNGSKLIITVARSGYQAPEEIPDSRDKAAIEHCLDLSRNLKRELGFLTGDSPHMIVNTLHPVKLNCDAPEPSGGNPVALDAYRQYSSFIKQARRAVGQNGLLLDVHSHSGSSSDQPHDWTFFGFLPSGRQLGEGVFHANQTSIRNLFVVGNDSLDEIMRGDHSLGGHMANMEYNAIPSPEYPEPEADVNYVGSSYTIRTYGSREEGETVDAVRISVPSPLITGEGQIPYSKVLAQSLHKFYTHFYPQIPRPTSRSHLSIFPPNVHAVSSTNNFPFSSLALFPTFLGFIL